MAALVIAAFTWWQGRPVELEGIPGEDVALGQPVGPARGDAIDAVDAGGGAMAGAARAPGGPSSVGGQSGTAPAGAGSRMGSLPGGEGAMVVVHVVGAVASPGVVTLPAGSRVTDAVQAVGGARTTKALASVNLARVLVDGEQIVVDADGLAAATSTVTGSTLSLNRATAADLEDLPGVGPVLAQRIIDWRAAHGPFRTIDELSEVSGIGEALLADLSTRVRP